MQEKSLIKARPAIQISNNLNLLQRKAWNVLLATAYYNLPIQDIHRIEYDEFMKFLNFDSKNDEYIFNSLEKLQTTTVRWNVLDKDESHRVSIPLLAGFDIEKSKSQHSHKKKKYFLYSFSPFLVKELYNPKFFARINLNVQKLFQNKHALALYEFCVDYKGVKITPTLSLEDLKLLLGFDKDEYPDFKILNRDVIKPAVSDINEKSDIYIDCKFNRGPGSRKVTSLKFLITIKTETPSKAFPVNLKPIAFDTTEITPEKHDEIYNRLINTFKLSPLQATRYMKEIDEVTLLRNLAHVERRVAKGEVKNIAAYTVNAIEENIQDQLTFLPNEVKANAAKKDVLKLEEEYTLYFRGKVKEARTSLPESKIKELENAAKNEIDHEFSDKKIGYNVLVKSRFENFLADAVGTLSFEEWKDTHNPIH